MKLTLEQFKKIRSDLHWSLTTGSEGSDEIYYTLNSKSDTMLFWYDFMRFIFIDDVLKKQNVIQRITTFSQNTKVLLEKNTMNLILPLSIMEAAVHFASTSQMKPAFLIKLKMNTIMMFAFLFYIVLLSIAVYIDRIPDSAIKHTIFTQLI